MSFRWLNPRLVDGFPYARDSVCYLAYGDEPETSCDDIPPNRWRFLGTWYLSPERHFYEWIGFVSFGLLLIALFGPKLVTSTHNNGTESQPMKPRIWMKVATLAFYPYVAWTKLSWEGSNYPGRWLLFVGMPVGTLWILSAMFTFGPFSSSKRQWLIQTWLSFVPSLFPVLGALFGSTLMTEDIMETIYELSYCCHGVYLVAAPVFYVVSGEVSMLPENVKGGGTNCINLIFQAFSGCFMWQAVGNALASIYYIGVITPASIIAGLNVHSMLSPGTYDADKNYRIHSMVMWFLQGLAIRVALCAVELVARKIRSWTRTDKRQE